MLERKERIDLARSFPCLTVLQSLYHKLPGLQYLFRKPNSKRTNACLEKEHGTLLPSLSPTRDCEPIPNLLPHLESLMLSRLVGLLILFGLPSVVVPLSFIRSPLRRALSISPFIPLLAPKLASGAPLCDPNLTTLTTGPRTVTLLGSAHISSLSAELARSLVLASKPDSVFVELDAKRVRNVPLSGVVSSSASAEQGSPPLQSRASQGLTNLLGKILGKAISSMYKSLDSSGFSSGAEVRPYKRRVGGVATTTRLRKTCSVSAPSGADRQVGELWS